eukprot:RCo004111
MNLLDTRMWRREGQKSSASGRTPTFAGCLSILVLSEVVQGRAHSVVPPLFWETLCFQDINTLEDEGEGGASLCQETSESFLHGAERVVVIVVATVRETLCFSFCVVCAGVIGGVRQGEAGSCMCWCDRRSEARRSRQLY